MNNTEREFFVSRICAGYVRCRVFDHDFRIYPPTEDILYEANELVLDIINTSEGLSDDDVMFFLFENGQWTLQDENRYTSIPKDIEEIKVQMYEAVFKSNLREKLKKELEKLNKEYNELSDKKSAYYYLTTNGIALTAKTYYIIERCTYLDGKLYDWSKIPILSVINKYNSLVLSDHQIREISRTEPWLSTWSIKKESGKLFNEPLSYEQKQLVLYSKFYDSVYEAAERPSQEVIDDDDLLDGWLIINRRKREAEQPSFNITNPKIAGADEIFIIAETGKDIEKINNLNNPRVRALKKQRMNTLERNRQMSWLEFADMQQNINMERTRLERESMKR